MVKYIKMLFLMIIASTGVRVNSMGSTMIDNIMTDVDQTKAPNEADTLLYPFFHKVFDECIGVLFKNHQGHSWKNICELAKTADITEQLKTILNRDINDLLKMKLEVLFWDKYKREVENACHRSYQEWINFFYEEYDACKSEYLSKVLHECYSLSAGNIFAALIQTTLEVAGQPSMAQDFKKLNQWISSQYSHIDQCSLDELIDVNIKYATKQITGRDSARVRNIDRHGAKYVDTASRRLASFKKRVSGLQKDRKKRREIALFMARNRDIFQAIRDLNYEI